MLTGNRKLASVIAGLLVIAGEAALTAIGVPNEVALAAISTSAALAAGGAMFGKDGS